MGDLFISHLRLSQFRSHGATTLDCDQRPIAIYGPNGAGKTNILEAISLLSPGRGLRRASAEDMARKPTDVGWKLRANLTSLGHSHEVETSFVPNGARTVRINDKSATQVALGRLARILWLVPSMDRLWIEGADGRRRFLDRATLSFEPRHAEASLTYEKAMRERNRLLKDMVRDAHWYRALERQMAEAATEIVANRAQAVDALMAAQDQSKTTFPSAFLELIHPEFDLPLDVAGFEDLFALNRNGDIAAGRTRAGPHRMDLAATFVAKSVPARECSTGEQKALLISLILSNARALTSSFGAAPILLLDEVAAHLDVERRAALYEELSDLGAQCWMTGTGVELFDELENGAQYIEVTEENGTSIATLRNQVQS